MAPPFLSLSLTGEALPHRAAAPPSSVVEYGARRLREAQRRLHHREEEARRPAPPQGPSNRQEVQGRQAKIRHF